MFSIFQNSVKATQRALTLASISIVISAVLIVLQGLQPACAQTTTDEYKVKAAFLFHFALLVDWPSDAFNSGDQSFNLCIFDDEPHVQELRSTVEGKQIGARVAHVRLLSQTQSAQGCRILFLTRDEDWRQAAVLRSLRGQPVLTVGEADDFLSQGGIIRLRLEKDKIRFDINVDVADSSHLKISSRLLLLASSITLGDKPKGGQ